VVADNEHGDPNKVMRVPRRKKKRRKILKPSPLMRAKSSTRMARNSAATSATVANVTSVMSVDSLTRLDQQLVILPSPVVDDDELLVVNPKHLDFASTSVITRSASMEMNVVSSTVMMTSVNVFKLVHSVKLLGSVTNSVTKVPASLEIDADSLTVTRPLRMEAMRPMLRRMLRKNNKII